MMLDPDIVLLLLTTREPALKVKVDSPFKVFAVPDPVITLLSALLFIVTPDIPVKFEPSPYKVSKYPFLHLIVFSPMS